MYVLVSAIARLAAPGSPLLPVDLSTLTLAQIESTYEQVHLRVSSSFWDTDRTMLFSSIIQNNSQRNVTLEQFFTNNGNKTLESIEGIATVSKGRVKYADAYWAGYTVRATRYGASSGTVVSGSEADTITLTKPGVDGRIFHKNCLVSVNGLLHRVDADSQTVYVLQGGRSAYHSKRNEFGIYNFKNVGELECVSITPDLLFKAHPDQPFANQIFLKLPVPSENKTVGLVFGGYLHLLDNLTFFRTGVNTFCLDIQSIALIERFFESRQLIDLAPLGLEYNGAHDAQISVTQLLSDEVLTKWLTLSQSFFVLIDTPDLTIEREALPPTQLAKQYIIHKDTTLPLVGGFGLLQPYWKYEDDNQFAITVGDNIHPNYLFRTTPPGQVPMPADNLEPYNRQSYSQAYFLDIRSEKIVITQAT